MTIIRLIVALRALALSTPAGINWRTVWLETNPVNIEQGSSISYAVKGINGMNDAQ
jgi:hypothetical protein